MQTGLAYYDVWQVYWDQYLWRGDLERRPIEKEKEAIMNGHLLTPKSEAGVIKVMI